MTAQVPISFIVISLTEKSEIRGGKVYGCIDLLYVHVHKTIWEILFFQNTSSAFKFDNTTTSFIHQFIYKQSFEIRL